MKRRNFLQIALMTLVATVAFLVLRSSGPAGENEDCKESMEQCTKKKDAGGSDKMIWENLSQQFFSAL